MNMNMQRRFTSRRVHNLKEISVASGQNSFIAQNSGPSFRSPAPTEPVISDDEVEDDPELHALRRAALMSRKRVDISVDVNPSSARNVASGRTSRTVRQHVQIRGNGSSSGVRVLRKPAGIAQRTGSVSPEKYTGNKSTSKLEDLNLEDLRQVYRASKRSRYDRRDGSELSSSEDDDYDYVKSRRNEASTDTSASKLKNHRNGSDSTSVPAFQRQTSNNNSIHTRITRPDRYHNNQPLPQKSSTNSNLTNNTTIVTKSSDQDLIDGATMERRRQKFQAGMEVIPDERTKVKVSLASLKSNNPLSSAAITYQETEKTATD